MAKKNKANIMTFKKSVTILNSMVVRNVKTQYRNSFLGILWTVLNPLLNMLVMAFVFSSIFGREGIDMDYPIYIFTGTIVFSLLRMSTTSSLPCIVNNYDLLTKTRVPHYIFPTSHVFSATVNFLFSFVAMLIIMLVRIPNGVVFHWTILLSFITFLPLIMIFSAGISFFLSAVFVRFRDIKHFYDVILTLWMYLTPIFYPISRLSATIQQFMQWNPMYHFVTMFRNLCALGKIPTPAELGICLGFAVLFFIIGFTVFQLSKKKFVFYI